MKTTEMRELDAWIAENVMCWKEVNFVSKFKSGTFLKNNDADCLVYDLKHGTWKPTTDPSAAMMVLEKCAENTEQDPCIYMGKVGNEFIVGFNDDCGFSIESAAETLPLAVAIFAKQLFTK